ncbi:MAG: M48 family metalloprotease [Gammaproteobacteria bacterium]|nr:M48 family metalloprotease [Gammaproteobacteria bacterium]
MMDPKKLRSQHDIELSTQLLEDREVIKVNERIAKQVEKGNLGVRRRLLSTSVRLSKTMARDLHKTADACIEKLMLDIPLELYVFPSPSYNAACVKPEDGRLFVMFSSSILEAFSPEEIRFVVGHELGHHLYNHHDIPIGYIMRGNSRPNPRLALTLTSWSRYAEISADRAGAYCANDLSAVAHALFKLASGLSGSYANFSLQDFLAQVDEMQLEDGQPGQGAPTEDWFLTHPFSPLRVKALKLFHDSKLMTSDGESAHELDLDVEGLMSLMEPSYLEGKTDTAEAMRRLLFAAAIAVADASGGISDEEKEVFEEFFGKASFSEKLDIEQIKNEVPDRVSSAKELTSIPQRMQVIRDLCMISRADGRTSSREQEVICEISNSLEVPTLFVEKNLSADTELD